MKRINRFGNELTLGAVFTLSVLLSSLSLAEQPASDVWISEARSAFRSAKYKDVLNKVSDILAKNPTDVAAWCLKGEAYGRLNDASAAIESFDKGIQANKNSIHAVVGKANALVLLKREAEASGLLQRAMRMTPSSPTDFLARGAAFRSVMQYDKAVADYEEALKADPSFAEVHLNKGMVFYHKNDFASAILSLTEAIRLDPNYVEALTNRGAAYRKKGDIVSAIADYSKAIQVNPNDAMTFYNRGVAYVKQQLYSKAIDDFSSAIRLQPRYPEAYVNRGAAHIAINKKVEARRDFEKALEIDSSGAASQNARRGLEMLKN